jgi:hypothetical protein
MLERVYCLWGCSFLSVRLRMGVDGQRNVRVSLGGIVVLRVSSKAVEYRTLGWFVRGRKLFERILQVSASRSGMIPVWIERGVSWLAMFVLDQRQMSSWNLGSWYGDVQSKSESASSQRGYEGELSSSFIEFFKTERFGTVQSNSCVLGSPLCNLRRYFWGYWQWYSSCNEKYSIHHEEKYMTV